MSNQLHQSSWFILKHRPGHYDETALCIQRACGTCAVRPICHNPMVEWLPHHRCYAKVRDVRRTVIPLICSSKSPAVERLYASLTRESNTINPAIGRDQALMAAVTELEGTVYSKETRYIAERPSAWKAWRSTWEIFMTGLASPFPIYSAGTMNGRSGQYQRAAPFIGHYDLPTLWIHLVSVC